MKRIVDKKGIIYLVCNVVFLITLGICIYGFQKELISAKYQLNIVFMLIIYSYIVYGKNLDNCIRRKWAFFPRFINVLVSLLSCLISSFELSYCLTAFINIEHVNQITPCRTITLFLLSFIVFILTISSCFSVFNMIKSEQKSIESRIIMNKNKQMINNILNFLSCACLAISHITVIYTFYENRVFESIAFCLVLLNEIVFFASLLVNDEELNFPLKITFFLFIIFIIIFGMYLVSIMSTKRIDNDAVYAMTILIEKYFLIGLVVAFSVNIAEFAWKYFNFDNKEDIGVKKARIVMWIIVALFVLYSLCKFSLYIWKFLIT